MDKPTALDELLYLMSRLREPVYGCPWDLAQSYKTIAPSTLEEAYEVVDAIENGDLNQLKDELGDLLFQVIFYCQLAKEESVFDFDDVASAITQKLLRRHPHVFPDGSLTSRRENVEGVDTDEAIKQNWEKIKQTEREQKGHKSLLDDVPHVFPAMTRAYKLQKRAASAHFDWTDVDGVFDKLNEEVEELKEAAQQAQDQARIEEELGDLFFTLVNLSRHYKVEPESALRRANAKFERRFRGVELLATQQGLALEKQSPDTLESWWEQVKQQ